MRESYDIFTVCRKEERYKVKCFDFWKYVIPDTILTIKWAIKNFLANAELTRPEAGTTEKQ